MVSIAISRIQNPGNLGAIARILKNFSIKELYLINPECNHLDQEARNRAKHAQDILENAKIIKNIKSIKANTIIATTSRLGTDFNLPRSPLTPNLVFPLKDKNTCFLFGSEEHGLTNEEIKQSNFTLTIPASKKYPTLNISHAVAIICYEIFKQENEHVSSHIKFITQKEKDILAKLFNETLNTLSFTTEYKKETQKKTFKNIIGKANLTRREFFALAGLLKKLKKP